MDTKTGQKIGSSRDSIAFVKDRPGHDIRYAIDQNKACAEIGYKACFSFEQALSETIDWYLSHRIKLEIQSLYGQVNQKDLESCNDPDLLTALKDLPKI